MLSLISNIASWPATVWEWLTAAPSRFIYVGIGLVVLLFLWWLIWFLIRKKHDKRLLVEKKKENDPPPTDAMRPEVSVTGEEQLEEESTTLFYPIPGAIWETVRPVSWERDGVAVQDSARYEEVNGLLTDEEAEELTAVVLLPKKKEPKIPCKVYLDTLSGLFSDGSYVDLKILKQEDLVPQEANCLIVHARGDLRKSLTIQADDFSLEAVKMISLAGGRAILIQSAE